MAVVRSSDNTLAHYGALSVYGSDIPLACAGIISKVNMIFMSFVIGISQGIQPSSATITALSCTTALSTPTCWRWVRPQCCR